MKTLKFQKVAAALVATSLALLATNGLAQDSQTAAPTATASAPAPQLSSGATEVLHLAQAKVGNDTIIAYIKNSGIGYSLNADQIIYLGQQGVSAAVINVMLNQPKPVATATAYTAPAPQPAAETVVTTPAPTVTYVQTPNTYYYYSAPYYYPVYYSTWCRPAVSLSFGWGGCWGGGWRGGSGWHGGGGGWHSGGGWHGGGHR